MLLGAEDQADLLGGIGDAGGSGARRSLHDVLEDGFSRLILEFGFLRRLHRGEERSDYDNQAGEPAESCERR